MQNFFLHYSPGVQLHNWGFQKSYASHGADPAKVYHMIWKNLIIFTNSQISISPNPQMLYADMNL